MSATRRQSRDPANRTRTGTAGDDRDCPWDKRRESDDVAVAAGMTAGMTAGAAADNVGAVGGERTRKEEEDVLGIYPTSEGRGVPGS